METQNASSLSPIQAGFRLIVEIVALICWGGIGWQITDGSARWILVILLPFAAASVWGTFRVPGDLSASGEARVPVPGVVRLFIELDILLGAAIIAALVWQPYLGGTLAVAVLIHYAMTAGRVRWLLAQRVAR